MKIYTDSGVLQSQKFEEKEKHYIESYTSNPIVYLEKNWDLLTVAQLIDYVNYLELYDCIVITNNKTERLCSIIEYVEIKTNTHFYINPSITQYSYLNFFEENFGVQDNSIFIKERLDNSYNAIKTGIYMVQTPTLLKHVVIDRLSSLNQLDPTVIDCFGVNSLILVKIFDIDLKNLNYHWFNILDYFIFMNREISQNLKFGCINYQTEKKKIDEFILNGYISNSGLLPKNIAKYFSNNTLNSLFIKHNDIYYDSEYKIKLSNCLKSNISQILNNLTISTFFKTTFSLSAIHTYFTCTTIAGKYNKPIYFVTPFNSRKLDAITLNNVNIKYLNILGYISNDKYFIYNRVTQKTYRVNSHFMDTYEYIIKNNFINTELNEINKVENLLNQVL